nr:MAG TPA: hypothetical protein [Caudoviricetes sp.]
MKKGGYFRDYWLSHLERNGDPIISQLWVK